MLNRDARSLDLSAEPNPNPAAPHLLISDFPLPRRSRLRKTRWNCAQVNKKYPHGIGKAGAHDKTTGTPVTSFKRSNALYKTAASRAFGSLRRRCS